MSKKINGNPICTEKIPAPIDLWEAYPLSLSQQAFIEQSRRQITEALNPNSPKLILIVGPCSIHDVTAAKEYATKLRALAKQTADQFVIVMRVYYEKPRTTTGWKGILSDPHLNGSNAMAEGLRLTRGLLLDLAELEIPTATEFLDPLTYQYLNDLIAWGCIGARTSESQTHRQIASALPMPVAFKNSTAGSVEVAVSGILSAQQPHVFLGIDEQGQVSKIHSMGNPHCHVALRGGQNGPNYDPATISKTLHLLKQHHLPARVLIDCSHDNSCRNHENQAHVFQSVIHQILEGEKGIRGLILESHLEAGNQPIPQDPSLLRYAVSLTDPCIDWITTEQLVLWAYERLCKEKKYATSPL